MLLIKAFSDLVGSFVHNHPLKVVIGQDKLEESVVLCPTYRLELGTSNISLMDNGVEPSVFQGL